MSCGSLPQPPRPAPCKSPPAAEGSAGCGTQEGEHVADIRMERSQNNVLPWLLGLALFALVIIGLILALAESASGADAGGGG